MVAANGLSVVGKDRPRSPFRRSKRAAAGAGIALAALVLIPSATVAGLLIGIPPSSGRPPVPVGGGGVSVTISVRFVCMVAPVEERPAVCVPMQNTLMFSAALSGGASASLFVWTFGDGSFPEFGQVLQHTFPSCDLYTVSVVAFGAGAPIANSTAVYPCAA